jgi:hypothetical protein
MDSNINAHCQSRPEVYYRLSALLARMRIHQLLLGLPCPASLDQVLPLGVTEHDFEALRSFEESLNMQREQRGEPKLDLVCEVAKPQTSLVLQQPESEEELNQLAENLT